MSLHRRVSQTIGNFASAYFLSYKSQPELIVGIYPHLGSSWMRWKNFQANSTCVGVCHFKRGHSALASYHHCGSSSSRNVTQSPPSSTIIATTVPGKLVEGPHYNLDVLCRGLLYLFLRQAMLAVEERQVHIRAICMSLCCMTANICNNVFCSPFAGRHRPSRRKHSESMEGASCV